MTINNEILNFENTNERLVEFINVVGSRHRRKAIKIGFFLICELSLNLFFFNGINELSKIYRFKWDFKKVIKRHYSENLYKFSDIGVDDFNKGHSHVVITIGEAVNLTESNLLFDSTIMEISIKNNNFLNIKNLEVDFVNELNKHKQQIDKNMLYNNINGFLSTDNYIFFKKNIIKIQCGNSIFLNKNETISFVNITNLTRSQKNADIILNPGQVSGVLLKGLNLFKGNSLNFFVKEKQDLLKVICYIGLCYEIDNVNKSIIINTNGQNKLDMISENNVSNILNLMKLDVIKFEKIWQQNNQQLLDFLIERWKQ